MGLSHGIVFPSGAITVMRSVPQSNLILANSVYLLAFDMGGFVGPLIASVIVSGFNIHLALSWISIFPLAALAYIIYTLKFVNSARYTKNQQMKYFMR